MFFCDLCGARACHDCANDMRPVFCEGRRCNLLVCGRCASSREHMEMCCECSDFYCNVRGCADQFLKFVSDDKVGSDGEEDGELRMLCPKCRAGNDSDEDAADD